MTDKRFSKALLTDVLTYRIGYLVSLHNFDLGNGTAQLKAGDVDRAVAYGEMRFCESLLEDLHSGQVGRWLPWKEQA
jgi:hypothetical protein